MPSFTRDPAAVFFNELHYDNRGVDQNEGVELAGPAEPISPAGGWSSTTAAMHRKEGSRLSLDHEASWATVGARK